MRDEFTPLESPPKKANFEATLFSMARFCIYSALEYGCHLWPVHWTKEALG